MYFTGTFKFNFKYFVLNLFGYRIDYIKVAWYVRFYLEIILTFYIFVPFIKNKKNNYTIPLAIFMLWIIKVIVSKYDTCDFIHYLIEYLDYSQVVLMGVLFAARNIFKYIIDYLKTFNHIVYYIFLCFIIFILRGIFKEILFLNLDSIYAPL